MPEVAVCPASGALLAQLQQQFRYVPIQICTITASPRYISVQPLHRWAFSYTLREQFRKTWFMKAHTKDVYDGLYQI
jgi:hypothetical protein